MMVDFGRFAGNLDRRCRIGKVRAKAHTIANAHSLGLEYPFVFSELAPQVWAVFRRTDGLADVFCQGDARRPFLAERAAERECERLNGISHWPTPAVIVDMDAEE